MYLVYLSTMFALSVGIGAFVQFDTVSTQQDAASRTRVEVQSAQQEQLSRALRRQYQINPSSFPTPAPGSFSRLNSTLLQNAAAGGLVVLQSSDYYINDSGEIIAVLKEGPSSPESLNGDRDLGIFSRPQFLEDFLTFLFGADYERGPGVVTSGNLTSWSSFSGAETITQEAIASLDAGAYTTVAQITLPKITVGSAAEPSATYAAEADFSAISEKYGLGAE